MWFLSRRNGTSNLIEAVMRIVYQFHQGGATSEFDAHAWKWYH